MDASQTRCYVDWCSMEAALQLYATENIGPRGCSPREMLIPNQRKEAGEAASCPVDLKLFA